MWYIIKGTLNQSKNITFYQPNFRYPTNSSYDEDVKKERSPVTNQN